MWLCSTASTSRVTQTLQTLMLPMGCMCHICTEVKRKVHIQKRLYPHFFEHSLHNRCLCIAALELTAGQGKWLKGPFFGHQFLQSYDQPQERPSNWTVLAWTPQLLSYYLMSMFLTFSDIDLFVSRAHNSPSIIALALNYLCGGASLCKSLYQTSWLLWFKLCLWAFMELIYLFHLTV